MTGYDESRLDDLPPAHAETVRLFDKKKGGSREDSTVKAYLNEATNFLEWLRDNFDGVVELEEINEMDHCRPFHAHLIETTTKNNQRSHIITVRNWAECVDHSTEYDMNVGAWKEVEDDLPSASEARNRFSSIDGASPAEMGRAFMTVTHPMWFAFFLYMLKASARTGAACNLKLQQVHLADPDFHRVYDDLGIEFVEPIATRPDTVYIDGSVSGTKRATATVLPVDGELKTALLRALAIRPTTPASLTDDQCYFFTSLATNYGLQQSTSNVDQFFKDVFVAQNDHIPDAMSPNDLRHWSNRQMRATPRLDGVLVDYIRGKAPDVDDLYDNLLADYDDRVRKQYCRHMPSIFIE